MRTGFKLKKIRKHTITVYLDMDLLSWVIVEAGERHRKLGPTIVAILREYFAQKKGGKDVNPNAA